ncbi:hypothetical protein MTR67_007858 [Solanum verrucosum]|uniref:4-coumarate--CoA ligase n=1 Tax=Solanum verrucosum TaxID=315347 RepID=A0AAF0Q0T8_SOLVR|nr:hypothetical protein MTR67_007858 [Solanum verrucosum]
MDELKPTPPNSSPLTPITFLERAATIYGDCPSIVYNNTTHNWSQTHSRCLKVASSIASFGIQRNHVVSVVAPNIPAMYELHFAVPMAGAVLNTINLRLDARTISVLLRHSESKLLFVDCQSKSLILEALSLFPPEFHRPVLVLIEDEEFPIPKTDEFITTYEELVERGDSGFNWIRPKSEFDPIAMNYTSGTTSAPKGVVHSHRGIFVVSLDSLIEWSVPKQPVYLWTLPMFHANGWSYPWGMAAVVMHPDGYLEIKDRSKDVIISGGENLSSVEVESVLYTHPAINEAAVVARPDEFWGETPCAFVSLNGKHKASEKDIIEFCRAKLPHYMVPKTVIIKQELPKTSTGKIQKFVLRDIAKSMGKSNSSKKMSRM